MNTTYLQPLKEHVSAFRAKLSSVRHNLPKLALAGVASLSLLSSCIEETLPNTGYTQEQLSRSPKAQTGSFWAIPARIYLPTSTHTNFGWGTAIIIRNLATDEFIFAEGANRYNNWTPYARFFNLSENTTYTDYYYNVYYQTILPTNLCIRNFTAGNVSNLKNSDQGLLGAAYAFRAMSYLDLARSYEYLPNEKHPDGKNSEGNVITGLTVPIVTDETSQAASYNNPRATHEEMSKFILSDLDKAEALIGKLAETSTDLPHLGTVYGMKARLYMWDGNYAKAAEYARKAINEGYVPTTQAQWLSTTTGFNTPTAGWMLSASINSETLGNYNLMNWTSHMAPETTFGYAGGGKVPPTIDRALYDKIANTDFRKLSFKAPKGHPLDGKTPYIHPTIGARLDTYASVKFRPSQGEIRAYKTAAVGSFPLMRVEEMYLIEAEAVAHTNAAQGLALLNTFMQTYRDKNYNFTDTNTDKLVQEIILQKRIELWGEGQTYFDYKRLNMSVTRAYAGSNWPEEQRFNTNGRPGWMALPLSKFEGAFNKAVEHYNNPDPSNQYSAVL